ncbi:hypothetical protein IH980_03660 [Patescibacteria group bacterium]|nr:hypothetical protein [Patescibacteria group bacterium]
MSVVKKVGVFLGHAFLPQRSNNQRPRILHPAGLSVLVAIFLLNFSLRTLISYLPGFILGFSSSVTVDQVIAQTNQERNTAGLPLLVQNPLLSQAAQAKAVDMFSLDYWAHVSPTGTQPWTFIKSTGYTYRYAGENLARDFSDSPTLMNAWMGSSSHRENILNSRYSEIGVAVVDGRFQGVETRLVVQMFATPTPVPVARVQPKPKPQAPAPISEETTQQAPADQEASLKETPFLTEGEVRQEPKPQFAGTTTIERITWPLEEERIVSPTGITQAFGMILMVLILGTLVVDWVIAHRRKTVRLVGRNWAHITYLGAVLLMMLQFAQGKIL